MYPLERHLREWVERANEATVNATNGVLKAVAEKLMDVMRIILDLRYPVVEFLRYSSYFCM